MTAIVTIQPDFDLVYLLGMVGAGTNQALVRDDSLEVEGVAQTDLDAALVQYTAEHNQRMADNAARQAIDAINRAAGIARQRYITVSPGQELVYATKERQAREFAAAAYQGAIPAFVDAEANASGATPQAACDSIIALADQWIAIGSAIDQARRAGVIAVESARVAQDVPAIDAARDTAITTIAAL